ncbi:MAG: LysM peptidoglycan-binding domain-containing protein [Bacillota bacterium]|nr:LysM peptidoglycan-binding domain-containing protein [Bacillota bacterium]
MGKTASWRKLLAVLGCLCAVIALTVVFTAPPADAASVWEKEESGLLVVSGSVLVDKPSSTADEDIDAVIASLSNETAYSMADLQAMTQTERVFSTFNTSEFRKQYLASGVDLYTLLGASGFDVKADAKAKVTFFSGSYKREFAQFAAEERYRYPQQAAGKQSGAVAVAPMIVLKSAVSGDNSDEVPAAAQFKTNSRPSLAIGMADFTDKNNSSFVKDLDTILVGEAVSGNTVTVLGKGYTRAQLLAMDRVTATYTYITKKGQFTDTVRGVALSSLVTALKDSDTVQITYADGYAPTQLKVSDIRNAANRYMLALEKQEADGSWSALYKISDGFCGFGALYNGKAGAVGGGGPAQMIAGIGSTDVGFDGSPYKHITYQGTEQGGVYAMDAITGATLTVEGPGVTATTPLMVGDLEKTASANLYRGKYTDTRNGTATTLVYEGVRISSIIQGLVNSGVERVNDDIRVVFKNRWRQDVAVLTYAEILAAKTPVILAYGTGSSDGATVAPFVYDNELGIINSLGNNDGCLKLVYDKSDFKTALPEKFSSVAYIYVEFTAQSPGYKHSEASNVAYSNTANTEYLITLTGAALGREVNYTVEELEAMVEYDATDKPLASGLGYRSEYSLSNTTYWYVNTYEGVKLWDLLLTLGLDGTKYKNDSRTLVTFSSWDNYKTTAAFSMKQLANPDLSYFYEKSPSDIGTDRPTKQELALKENQPDNQVGAWVKDANGYPVKKGYPVLLAYGVNGYPYVRNADMDGFFGGLGNDGGPVRVIFGKLDGMNRDNPQDITNYAYFFNNGSNQMQRAQEIYIGEAIRYSTHSQNPAAAYQALAKQTALTVEVVQANGDTETTSFTMAELEDIIYAVEKRDRDNENRQEKGYYAYTDADGALTDDLFEGVNIWYLLSETIGMPGSLGSADFYAGEQKMATLSFAQLQAAGYNSLRGTLGLEPVLAFAKNGYPLVADASSAGYVDVDSVTGISIENSGGPLAFIRPQTAEENKNGQAQAAVNGVTKIVVNLEADKYAHTDSYAALGATPIAFSGAVSNPGSLTVADIEKLQKYMVTDTYTVGGVTRRYRGVDLLSLLSDNAISASSMMSGVVISDAAGKQTKISANDLLAGVNGKRVILAYGIGDPAAGALEQNGLPLVVGSGDAGYNAAYGNSGGVLRLIVNGATAAQCLQNVSGVYVAKSASTGWTHTFGFYSDYLNTPILRVTGSDVATPVTFTVGQLESMSNEMVFDAYKVGNETWVQGVDLNKLLLTYVDLKTPTVTSITVYAKDAYATSFKGSDLTNGVNGKPMVIGYGSGPTSANGLPLVDGDDNADIKEGYDPEVMNAFGPIRLFVNDNTGWCVKWARCIVVGSGTFEDPAEFADQLSPLEVSVGADAGAEEIVFDTFGKVANSALQTAPAAVPVTPIKYSGGMYIVKAGDMLWTISRDQLGDSSRWPDIYELNNHIIVNPHLIYPGQQLSLPE